MTRAKVPGVLAARCVLADGGLEVAVWKGSNYRRMENCPGSFVEFDRGGLARVVFRAVPARRVRRCSSVAAAAGIRSAITFDREHVHSVWQITHPQGDTARAISHHQAGIRRAG